MSRTIRVGSWLLIAAGLMAGAACADLDRLADLAFPPQIAGLPANDRWVALPIGSWVTEGEVEATAMAACFAPSCEARVAVGVFRARGREARLVEDLVADPARLSRWIEERDRRDPNARRRKIRTLVSRERVNEGRYRGLAVGLGRADGTHKAFGLVLTRPEDDGVVVVLAIGADRDAVRRTVASVTAARG